MKSFLLVTFFVMFSAYGAPLAAQTKPPGQKTTKLDYDIQLDTISSGYDGKTCWVHPRAGTIPGEHPIVVLTMQKLLLTGSDVFYALNEMRTDDLGATWSGPTEHTTLGRKQEADGLVSVICDFTPMWHAKTGKLLGTGHVARYKGNHLAGDYERQTAYSVYDPKTRTWASWRTVAMPDEPEFYSSGAGCTQRVDLPNGDVLLPIYFKAKGEKCSASAVMRCHFDGKTLSYVEHGSEMTTDVPRGFGEPSLTCFKGRYYLTLRNDKAGYVTSGTNGLHFDKPRKWTFDDGKELDSYNTQQHWVTHHDGLFLVYTRRGAKNDHVFRHRAPLFIAQVDPDKLCVLRDTERILVPERGARLGNFAVTNVNDRETWVTVAEWMQTWGPDYVIPVNNKHGADNSVFVARIKWDRLNRPQNDATLPQRAPVRASHDRKQGGSKTEQNAAREKPALNPDYVWVETPAGKPVIDRGPVGAWDHYAVDNPYAFVAGGMYYCFFEGQDRLFGNGGHERIGLAMSADGTTWTKLAGNPILDVGAAGTWDGVVAKLPAGVVRRRDGTYFLFYSGRNNTDIAKTTKSIGVATAKRITGPWRKYPRNPVLSGRNERWDRHVTTHPATIFERNGDYWMLYRGMKGFYHDQGLGLAVSDDLLNWKRAGQADDRPLIPSNQEVASIAVVFVGGKYVGISQPLKLTERRYWYSDDLRVWKKGPPVKFKVSVVAETMSNPFLVNGQWNVLYEQRDRIYRAVLTAPNQITRE